MSRTVHCRRKGRELPGLAAPPFPGPLGQEIFANVSAEAWAEWLAFQTMLINEKHLASTDPQARRYLMEQMKKFIAGEAVDDVEGYEPPDA